MIHFIQLGIDNFYEKHRFIQKKKKTPLKEEMTAKRFRLKNENAELFVQSTELFNFLFLFPNFFQQKLHKGLVTNRKRLRAELVKLWRKLNHCTERSCENRH
jgi:hypothetical protein